MITYTLDASGLNLRLSVLSEKLKNTRPLMDTIGDYVLGSVKKNIDEGGRANKFTPNIWGTSPLKKTGLSYSLIRKDVISDNSVEVSSGGGNAGYSHSEHTTLNSPQAKRFFWFQYMQTKQIQWLYMALSKKAWFTHPQRRYMMFQEPLDVEEIKKMVLQHLQIN